MSQWNTAVVGVKRRWCGDHASVVFFALAPPRWTGKCWYYYNQLKYEFDLEFEVRGWVGWIVGCNPC